MRSLRVQPAASDWHVGKQQRLEKVVRAVGELSDITRNVLLDEQVMLPFLRVPITHCFTDH